MLKKLNFKILRGDSYFKIELHLFRTQTQTIDLTYIPWHYRVSGFIHSLNYTNPYMERLLEIHQRWCRNDLHAGTRKQEELLAHKSNSTNNLETNIRILQEHNLYTIKKAMAPPLEINSYEGRPGTPLNIRAVEYTYGSKWLVEPVPLEIVNEIFALTALLHEDPELPTHLEIEHEEHINGNNTQHT